MVQLYELNQSKLLSSNLIKLCDRQLSDFTKPLRIEMYRAAILTINDSFNKFKTQIG